MCPVHFASLHSNTAPGYRGKPLRLCADPPNGATILAHLSRVSHLLEGLASRAGKTDAGRNLKEVSWTQRSALAIRTCGRNQHPKVDHGPDRVRLQLDHHRPGQRPLIDPFLTWGRGNGWRSSRIRRHPTRHRGIETIQPIVLDVSSNTATASATAAARGCDVSIDDPARVIHREPHWPSATTRARPYSLGLNLPRGHSSWLPTRYKDYAPASQANYKPSLASSVQVISRRQRAHPSARRATNGRSCLMLRPRSHARPPADAPASYRAFSPPSSPAV